MLKTVSSVANAIGALNYKGTWNAATNNPSLSDGTGAKGDYYVVSTPGTQTFDGIQYSFGVGDWIVYNGAVWQRVEGGADGNFTNVTASGFVGTSATGALKTPVGTTAQRPTPVSGMFRMNSETGYAEYYNGSNWIPITTPSVVAVEYLTIAGGAGGGGGADAGSQRGAGGGGAGGYLTSTTQIVAGANYTVTVGSGGAAGTTGVSGTQGSAGGSSVFGAISTTGGGGGGQAGGGSAANGGSGGGGGSLNGAKGTGTAPQGNDGGNAGTGIENAGAGGGGAGAAAASTTTNSTGTAGGAGLASSITGSSVTRAGGGGGAGGGTAGAGGTGGGGNGATSSAGSSAGSANTGGGGGGGYTGVNASAGGSGVVILKYPSSYTLTIGAGLTASTTTSGSFKITTFTAGTDTISFGV